METVVDHDQGQARQNLQTESHFIQVDDQNLHVRRFFTRPDGPPVLMLHGSMSSGRTFYSLNNKGLAPWLARQGYDVYVPDVHGRGQSTPPIRRGNTRSQHDVITREIPAFIRFIQQQRGNVPIQAVAHSWGGVLLQAYIVRTPDHPLQSMVTFGTKRSIGLKNARRYFPVDIMWSGLGAVAGLVAGYMPAKPLKIAVENESWPDYRQSQYWVYHKKKWIDPQDGFDYKKALSDHSKKIPTLFLAGQNDHYLGHPADVRYFMQEINHPADRYEHLSVSGGNRRDYNHTDIIIGVDAEKELYPKVQAWLAAHAASPVAADDPTVKG